MMDNLQALRRVTSQLALVPHQGGDVGESASLTAASRLKVYISKGPRNDSRGPRRYPSSCDTS